MDAIKNLTLGFLIFTLFGLFPYALMEKKFNFYDLYQIKNYFLYGGYGINLTTSIYNFIDILLKNIVYIFYNGELLLFKILAILILLFMSFYNKYASKNYKVIFKLFLTYILIFGVVVKFEKSGFYPLWFNTVSIPLFIILFVSFLDSFFLKTKFQQKLFLYIFYYFL